MENNDQPEMIAARELLAHVASVIHEYIYPRWKEARESWFDGLETLIGEDVLSFLAGVADDHFLRGHSALSAALFVSTIEGWLKVRLRPLLSVFVVNQRLIYFTRARSRASLEPRVMSRPLREFPARQSISFRCPL
jgi:hypothetical protein